VAIGGHYYGGGRGGDWIGGRFRGAFNLFMKHGGI